MVFSRATRKLVTCSGICAMLFAQVAMATHACAPFASTEAPEAMVTTGAADDSPCDEKGVEKQNLCFRHCQDRQQALDHHPPSGSFVAIPAYNAERRDRIAAFASAARTYSHALLARATAPPLAVRNCCFRT